MPFVWIRAERGLQRGEEYRVSIRPQRIPQTPLVANVFGRRRLGKLRFPMVRKSPISFDTSKRAFESWDDDRRRAGGDCRRLIVGSLHESPSLRERAAYAASEQGGVVYASISSAETSLNGPSDSPSRA